MQLKVQFSPEAHFDGMFAMNYVQMLELYFQIQKTQNGIAMKSHILKRPVVC